jgi:hypothetical protein
MQCKNTQAQSTPTSLHHEISTEAFTSGSMHAATMLQRDFKTDFLRSDHAMEKQEFPPIASAY